MRALTLFAALLVLHSDALAQAERPKPAYDYSLPRDEKIKLAESAAPPEVAGKATVYVLERTGYVKAREGTNGFTCIVDRYTPLNSEPSCFDAEGSQTTLVARLFVEEQRAKGKTEGEIDAAVEQGYKSGKFRAPQKPGIVYMMSDSIFLYVAERNKLVKAPPHLMFYSPYATDRDIGSPPSAANMPHILRPGRPDAYMIVFAGLIGAPAKHPDQ